LKEVNAIGQSFEESPAMKNTNGENVYTMQVANVPAVVTMPSRNGARSSAVVVEMPSRMEEGVERHSKVVTLPARTGSRVVEFATKPSAMRSGYEALSAGVRMTLVALFALLGWPHPTRDNDPGPSAARPCHWERVSLISRLYLPSSRSKAAAASASVLQFPARDVAIDDGVLARAA
jgi:hypothetical protein